MVLGNRRGADRVAHPVVERADPGEEADRPGDETADEHDDLAEPDRMPAAPPAAQHDDPGADPEEERRHPGGAQQPGVQEAAPAAWRRRWAVSHRLRLVLVGQRAHVPAPFWRAHLSKASGCIT